MKLEVIDITVDFGVSTTQKYVAFFLSSTVAVI